MKKNNNEKYKVLFLLFYPIISLIAMYGFIQRNNTSAAVSMFLNTVFDIVVILYIYRKLSKDPKDTTNEGLRKKEPINQSVVDKVKDFIFSQTIEPLKDNAYYVIFNTKNNQYAGWYIPDLSQECFKLPYWVKEDAEDTIIEYIEDIKRVEKALCELVQYANINLQNIAIKQKELPKKEHSCYRNSNPDEFQ